MDRVEARRLVKSVIKNKAERAAVGPIHSSCRIYVDLLFSRYSSGAVEALQYLVGLARHERLLGASPFVKDYIGYVRLFSNRPLLGKMGLQPLVNSAVERLGLLDKYQEVPEQDDQYSSLHIVTRCMSEVSIEWRRFQALTVDELYELLRFRYFRRRAALSLSRSRRPQPERVASAGSRRGGARRLSPADPAAAADRPSRRRPAAAAARARAPADGGGALALPPGPSGSPYSADRANLSGVLLPEFRVRTDQRAL
jgi:hypothetical protein